jgi:hypothetical protein
MITTSRLSPWNFDPIGILLITLQICIVFYNFFTYKLANMSSSIFLAGQVKKLANMSSSIFLAGQVKKLANMSSSIFLAGQVKVLSRKFTWWWKVFTIFIIIMNFERISK